MSEYQYYEFVAVDRPLDDDEFAAVRAMSTRARMTRTRFVNDYQWGDFRGDPRRLVERYYDAHLYFANWGSRHVLFKFPGALLDPAAAARYRVPEAVEVWGADGNTLVSLVGEDEDGEWEDDAEYTLSSLIGIRAEVAAGDLRGLYVAWLAGIGAAGFDVESVSGYEPPPLPAGMSVLTGPQRALADFLRVDGDLLAAAADSSPLSRPGRKTAKPRLAAWIGALPTREKDAYLLRVAEGDDAQVRAELQRGYRGFAEEPAAAGRTVAELLADAVERRRSRTRAADRRRVAEEARRAAQAAKTRERHLDTLAADVPGAWLRVDALIAARRNRDYDEAVELLTCLAELARRGDALHTFTPRIAEFRRQHRRKTALLARLDKAGLPTFPA
ncbi:hypothetical protein OG948_50850 (plasmid) [Embleya sp. NBC_00888]|uniref:hypothetical protein n=1 Tax=Embleya sp. NBC_00888 TaxID=2975960 RepID=UPI002F916CFD|nr:hypothetical protein OG948_50850 [Embleya sp. NBC_00888]